MGRHSWSNRATVEECNSISIYWLKKQGYFRADLRYSPGGIKWTSSFGQDRGNIGFCVNKNEESGQITFKYTHTDRSTEEKEYIEYSADLVSTSCNYGGKRWWFICGASKNGIYCGRRVGKLYLAPGHKYFACRHCYNLTYHSCRVISDSKLVQRFIKMIGK